jgi:hypothetical protein
MTTRQRQLLWFCAIYGLSLGVFATLTSLIRMALQSLS